MDLTIPRVLLGQFLVGAALAAVLWGVFDRVVGYSVLLGSLITVIPNAFLALRLTLPRRDSGARALVNAAWIGEIGKLALTVLLFALVFTRVKPLSAAALFVGLIAAQLMTLSGLLMRGGTDTSNSNGS